MHPTAVKKQRIGSGKKRRRKVRPALERSGASSFRPHLQTGPRSGTAQARECSTDANPRAEVEQTKDRSKGAANRGGFRNSAEVCAPAL